jgi:putative ABC transport system permease protein
MHGNPLLIRFSLPPGQKKTCSKNYVCPTFLNTKEHSMEKFFQDLRYGARMMVKSPIFTIIAVIALALGIGASTAIFSVVNTVLLRSLPYKDADRLVAVWEYNRVRDRHQNVISAANFLDWQEQNTVFDDLAGITDSNINLVDEGEPEQLTVQYVTPNFFNVLGTQPIQGRAFLPDDGKPDQPNIVILSHGLWQRRFGADQTIIGRKLLMNGQETIVVGVLPANFKWFVKKGSLVGKPPDIWMPFYLGENFRVRRGRFMSAVGRLKSDVTLTQAQTEMNIISARLEEQYKDFNTGWGVEVISLREQLTGDLKPALLILLGAVGFVLLIACANVANLLLARAAARQKEMAVRSALGAGRWRIVRQLLTESLLLAFLGGALGLVLALWGTEALVSLSPPQMLDLRDVTINAPVLIFSLAISLVTGVIFGLVPAFEASRLNLSESLKEGGKNIGGTRRSIRLRSAFVVAEVALSLVLLIGAGLLIQSFMRLQKVDPGFNPENVLTMNLSLPRSKYPDDGQRINFFKQAVERLQALPGVESVGAVSFLPFAGPAAGTRFAIDGQPKPEAGQEPTTSVCVTDANYFDTLKIPLRRGRIYNQTEATEMRHVVLINEALARRYFPDEDPIGKRLTINMKNENAPTEIIGIVGDAKQETLESDVRPTIYWPHPELAYNSMTLVMRVRNNATAVAPAARGVIQTLDNEQPIAEVRTMESLLATSMARARFNTLLLAIFAMVALLLAAIGIYGVMSYTVSQRTHEIGIRMALGAQGADVLKFVIGQGMLLAGLGLGIGLGAAFGLTRLMKTLLFEISTTDLTTFVLIPLILAGVALLACLVPARRATKTDPMIALRYE